jgi:guanylate kinase
VEHASYAENRYGTLRTELERRARAAGGGAPVVLEIDLQGARQIRAAMPDAVQIFIAPRSLEQLRERLSGRGAEDPATVERRLAIAETELAARGEFRFVVVNDELDRAESELDRIYLQYTG